MRLLQCSTVLPPLARGPAQVYLAHIETHRAAVPPVEGSMQHTNNVLGISFVVAAVLLLGLAIAL